MPFLIDHYAGTGLLSAHAPDTGGSWTARNGSFTATLSQQVVNPVGGVLTLTSGVGPAVYTNSSTPGSADYSVETFVRNSGSQDSGVLLRANTTGTITGYQLTVSASRVAISKRSGTTVTDLATATPPTATSPVKLKGEMRGSTLKLYINDVVVLTVNDTTYTAAGLAGIVVGQNSQHYTSLTGDTGSFATTQGSASGTSASVGVGSKIAVGTGTAAGAATVLGVKGVTNVGVGTSPASSNAFGVGISFHVAQGTSDGRSSINGVAIPIRIAEAVGTVAGSSNVKGQGSKLITTVGSAVGASTVMGDSGNVIQEGVGTSTGTSSVLGAGVGLQIVSATGSGHGFAIVNGYGGIVGLATGSASGTATATGKGNSIKVTIGSASGKSTVLGQVPPTEAIGTSAGKATMTGKGQRVDIGTGSSVGRSTMQGAGAGLYASTGVSVGVAAMIGRAIITVPTTGSAAGIGSMQGVGSNVVTAIGTASGSSSMLGEGMGRFTTATPIERIMTLLATPPRLILLPPLLRVVRLEKPEPRKLAPEAAGARTLVLGPANSRTIVMMALPRDVALINEARMVLS